MKYIYMNKTDSIAVSDRHIAICTMKGAVSELNEVVARAESAEARAAELEAQLAGAAATIVTLTKERDEAKRRIAELEANPNADQPHYDDEWEKEYYLRGMHR